MDEFQHGAIDRVVAVFEIQNIVRMTLGPQGIPRNLTT